MRTTLTIDDEVLRAARSLARLQHKTVGRVLSELARKGLQPRPPTRSRPGFPVFEVSPQAAPLTPEMVRQALDHSA